ncbi:hypothetical protein PHYSODRAFT_286312 [Phytophthora sojae]|uniref:RxLR effector protein n=2 Tax=Phytophthora sojae TaxID=67593 RepID=G4ZN59_PHYSP|nr:hypothetical protein PHYSODRAFT_286312 [Phytophthora sojae]AEK80803.1 Avh164 [Phytophthora sojae]EGZ15382.1 hypothetical protein PHYSODRAFT_286312 [Phytophthora sojae]|eukprot:XP_009529131.1 hypothetical protein PHYSODRAFT_286312 [Phytophthora sojae]
MMRDGKIYRGAISSKLLAFLILFASVSALPEDTRLSKVPIAEHHFLLGGQSGQDGGHVNRHLRAGMKNQGSKLASSEERGPIDEVIAGTKKLWGKVKPNHQQAADELFASLKIQKPTSDVLKNPLLLNWIGKVNKLHPLTSQADQEILAKMTGLYGLEALSAMIVAAKRSPDVKAIALATKLETAQLNNWMTQGRNVDDVLRLHLLKLDDQGSALFNNPVVNMWAFAAKLEKNRAGEAMVRSLTTHYDEASLARLLLPAKKKSPELDAIATRIEDAQLKKWMLNDEKLDDVFRLLKLDDEGGKLFEKPLVEVWAAYAMRLDENRAGEMMIQLLATHFDDASLAKMLLDTNKATSWWKSDYVHMFDQLKEAQRANWAQRKTVDDVFHLLKLDEEGAKVFDNPLIHTWSSYAFKLDRDHEGEMMFRSLRTHYDEVTLTTMLAQAKPSITTGPVISELEAAQRKLWTDSGKTVDDVFRLLKLGGEGDKLFQGPVVKLWGMYAIKRDSKRAGELMLQSLIPHHDEIGLVKMLLEAKKSSDNLLRQIAARIEDAQLVDWARKGTTVDDAYRLLKLDDEGAKLFENPIVDVWISYATKLESRAAEKVFQALISRYDDASLATMLTRATRSQALWKFANRVKDVHFASWALKGKTVDDVYRLLKLDEAEEGIKLLDSRAMKVWDSYATMLHKERGGEVMLASLKAQYEGASLGRMIASAKQFGMSEDVATRLEAAQLTNWVDRRKSLDGVFCLLKLDEEGTKLFSNPAVGLWAAYATMLDKGRANKTMLAFLKARYDDKVLANMLIQGRHYSSLASRLS